VRYLRTSARGSSRARGATREFLGRNLVVSALEELRSPGCQWVIEVHVCITWCWWLLVAGWLAGGVSALSAAAAASLVHGLCWVGSGTRIAACEQEGTHDQPRSARTSHIGCAESRNSRRRDACSCSSQSASQPVSACQGGRCAVGLGLGVRLGLGDTGVQSQECCQVQCSAVQCSAVQCSVLYGTVRHCVSP
jgi:hypothetical protein